MHRTNLKPSRSKCMLQDTCKTAPPFDKVKTVLYFRVGFEAVLRKYSIKVLEVTRRDVKTLECVGAFMDRQIADEILEGAKCITDFARMIEGFDGVGRLCCLSVTDRYPKVSLRINITILT